MPVVADNRSIDEIGNDHSLSSEEKTQRLQYVSSMNKNAVLLAQQQVAERTFNQCMRMEAQNTQNMAGVQAQMAAQQAEMQRQRAAAEAARKADFEAFQAEVGKRHQANAAGQAYNGMAPDQPLPPNKTSPFTSTISQQDLDQITATCKEADILNGIKAMARKEFSIEVFDTDDAGINPAWRALNHLPGEPDTPFSGGPAGFITAMRNVQSGKETPRCAVTLLSSQGELRFDYDVKIVHGNRYLTGNIETPP